MPPKSSLEHQPQGKLHLARAAEVACGKARGSDLVKISKRCCSGSRSGRNIRQDEAWIAEVWMVEEVERLCAELQLEALGDLSILGDRKVRIHEAGTRDGVAAKVAESAGGSRENLVGWSEIDPSARATRHFDVAVQVGAKSPVSCECSVRGQIGQGITGLCLFDQTELPSGDQAVALERKLIEGAD